MKIFIITMEDPLYTNPFIKKILIERKNDIVGIAISKGDRLTIGKKRSKIVYLLSLLLIMGFRCFIRNILLTAKFKAHVALSNKIKYIRSPSIIEFAKTFGIRTYRIISPNKKDFLDELMRLEPDVIINQSQNIIKKKLLSIPKIGVINRHNSLLPKNRGRMSPFWILYKKEKKTGVTIHFVNEGIDSGDIIVQEKFAVEKKDNFNSITDKCYRIAPKAMLKAIDMLESGKLNVIENDDDEATYNSIPKFQEAFHYRISRFRSLFGKSG